MKPMLLPLTLLAAMTCAMPASAQMQHTPSVAAPAESAMFLMVAPNDLKWSDMSAVPGAKIAVIEGQMDRPGPITARIRLAANTEIPPHWHPGVERVTVLSGTLNYGRGDKLDRKKTTPLRAGSIVIMPPKLPHFVWVAEETVIQLNLQGPWGITWVNPADAPKPK